MKCDRIINPDIISEIAALGHTQSIVIGDCGLPIPKGVRVIDVSVVAGIPSFLNVLDAIKEELVIEKAMIANEMQEKNATLYNEIMNRFHEKDLCYSSHDSFKKAMESANCIIRTGENTSYANIILFGGVNF